MKTVKLGDVCDIIGGGTPSKSVSEYWGGDIRWASVRDMKFDVINETELKITSLGLNKSSSNLIPSGNVIIASRVGLGKVCWIDQPTAINQDLRAIVPRNKAVLDKKYLLWWLRSESATIVEAGEGATVQGVRLTFLNALMIPLPSLEEQRRVVERLDSAFEKIDRAIELTEENIKNTDDLFGSLLDKIVRQNPDIEDRSIGEIADIEYGLTEKSKAKGDYRLIRITDISSEGFLNNENKAHVSASQKSEKYLLHNGDIVVARTGATFGKVLFFDDEENAVFASYLIRINFHEKILPKLFWYFAKTPQYWDQANALAGGAAQPQFNGNALKRVKFSYPASRDEQQAIIEILDIHHQSTLNLKTMYQKKLNSLNALKQALLTQAFSQGDVE